MSNQFLIDIGVSGIFRLKTPFDTLLSPQTTYTCKGIRKLSEILASGIDAYEKYYSVVNETLINYNLDVENDINIISLFSSLGQWIYVPANSILGYPSVNGVTYNAVVLGLSLSALPDTTDLSALKTILSNIVKDTIGVDTVIKEIVTSAPTIISHDDHLAIQVARNALISIKQSDRALLTKSNNDLDLARLRITELENYIKTKL